MEAQFYGSEDLPRETGTAISPNGWISDELALSWLGYFITATADRVKRGEKRYLIFDDHSAHLTLEFLQKCEDNAIIPFGFLPHSTHLYQPHDGKPFLNYKQQFRLMNNELSFWGGQPYGKADFLSIIGPIRSKTFSQRIIRDSFKERGIWPVDGSKIVENLTSQLVISDIHAPNLRSRTATPTSTPSPLPDLLSSSIENSPPKSIEALEKNQAKIYKHLNSLSEKMQRDLTKIFAHQREKFEELAMTQDTIRRIRSVQEPVRRQYTKRQVKPLSQDGILKPRDANRSIRDRKAKEMAAEERKLAKQFEKAYGFKPIKWPAEAIQRAIENEKKGREQGDLFFIDNQLIG